MAEFTHMRHLQDFRSPASLEFFNTLIANVRGPYSAIRALRPLLRASGDAVVVNVSSISGFTASGSNVACCAAKAALDNISMSLGRAWSGNPRTECLTGRGGHRFRAGPRPRSARIWRQVDPAEARGRARRRCRCGPRLCYSSHGQHRHHHRGRWRPPSLARRHGVGQSWLERQVLVQMPLFRGSWAALCARLPLTLAASAARDGRPK